MTKYQLHKVATKHDAKVWLHLDRKIYKNCPYWVCPLDDDIEKVFDPKRNHLFEGGEAVRGMRANLIKTTPEKLVGDGEFKLEPIPYVENGFILREERAMGPGDALFPERHPFRESPRNVR